MIVHFLDTSALVKLYVREVGSAKVSTLVATAQTNPAGHRVCVSRIAFPETTSAVVRKRNRGSISPLKERQIQTRIFSEFTGPRLPFEVVEASHALAGWAALLVMQHRIRGMDAIHLASALYVRLRLEPGAQLVFVSADAALNRAARAENLSTVDPTKR